jgi:aconitate hydratase
VNLTHRLIESHLLEGELKPHTEIGLKVDQIFVDDSVGPLIALELEAMGIEDLDPALAVAYVDHLLLQEDHRNSEDHLLLRSAAMRYGMWYSPAGNGICHAVHLERFGVPGATLVGSDSHTCAAGALGMFAIGVGGLAAALALAGEPLYVDMPEVWGVQLVGRLRPWVSAKDVILEMLRRHGVDGAVGRVLEYFGPGLEELSVWDRHVISHMGAELGATTSVFPSDRAVLRFLTQQGRAETWQELAHGHSEFDHVEELDLSQIEPLIALPSSPGNVKPVREVAGTEIHQAYIGSSANPSFRDLAVAARIVAGHSVPEQVSFDVNPATRQILEHLAASGDLGHLIRAGARVHQAGCNGCPGMGQALAPGRNSLRTVPRNFPGRSGTEDDRVYLCSPETAAVSALAGSITDPRDSSSDPPTIPEPENWIVNTSQLVPPAPRKERAASLLVKSSGHIPVPHFPETPNILDLPVLLKLGNDISTDEILPAGTRVMPLWSHLGEVSKFAFSGIVPDYAEKAITVAESGHAVVAGRNYGQGSSRELAALSPRFLGLRAVIALTFARIHWENLINFGVLPLSFQDQKNYIEIREDHKLRIDQVHDLIRSGSGIVENTTTGSVFKVTHNLSERQKTIVLGGGVISMIRHGLNSASQPSNSNKSDPDAGKKP